VVLEESKINQPILNDLKEEDDLNLSAEEERSVSESFSMTKLGEAKNKMKVGKSTVKKAGIDLG